MPKAGTHLISSQLSRLPGIAYSGEVFTQDRFASARGAVGEVVPYDEAKLQRAVTGLPPGTFANAHLYWDESLARLATSEALSFVHVLRDPRDILLSMEKYISGFSGHPQHEVLMRVGRTRQERLALLIEGFDATVGRPMRPFADRLALYDGWLGHRHVFRFEDFLNPLVRESVQVRLLEAIGFSPNADALGAMSLGIGDPWSATFNTGRAGTWTSEFTDDLYQLFVAHVGVQTEKMGYIL